MRIPLNFVFITFNMNIRSLMVIPIVDNINVRDKKEMINLYNRLRSNTLFIMIKTTILTTRKIITRPKVLLK